LVVLLLLLLRLSLTILLLVFLLVVQLHLFYLRTTTLLYYSSPPLSKEYCDMILLWNNHNNDCRATSKPRGIIVLNYYYNPVGKVSGSSFSLSSLTSGMCSGCKACVLSTNKNASYLLARIVGT